MTLPGRAWTMPQNENNNHDFDGSEAPLPERGSDMRQGTDSVVEVLHERRHELDYPSQRMYFTVVRKWKCKRHA